jgi:hypothetical protein
VLSVDARGGGPNIVEHCLGNTKAQTKKRPTVKKILIASPM